jgi:phage baseplate assembly protein W
MADVALTFGGDLSLSPTGDIALSDGTILTQQRVLRRLLTNQGGYIWQLGYGAGLAQFVGQPAAPAAIQAIVRGQILKEAAVAKNPAPVVTAVGADDGTVTLTITYTDAYTQQTSILTFPVSP